MLARSIPARAIVQSRLQPAGLASVRRLSMAPRASAVALGKRPALPLRSALAFSAIGASRSVSIFSKDSPAEPASAAEPTATPAEVIANGTEASTSASASAASVNTPLPSSDIPSIPSHPVTHAPEPLTSTAPDHLFHSDPTPLLPQSPANAQTPTLEDLITNSGLPLEEVLNSPEAVHAAMKVSDLKLMGLEHGMLSLPGWMRDGLVAMHEVSGLPWWASIMAMTVAMRLCLFPMVVKNLKHNLRMSAVSEQFQALMKRMTDAKSAGDSLAQNVAVANLQTLMKTHDISPFRPLLMPLISVPFFLSMFYSLRKLAALPLPQLKEGGFGWVLDLTLADPYYILPMTSIGLQYLALRIGVDGTGTEGKPESARTMAHFRNGLLALSPLLVFMVSYMPAAVLFYWTSANFFTLTQAWLLRQTFVRRILGVVEPPKIKAPPTEKLVNANPTMKETWAAFMDMQNNMMKKTTERVEQQSKVAAERERLRSQRAGTGLLAERVTENKRGVSAGFLETASESSKEDSRAKRLHAARVKREQQKGQ